MVEETQEQAIGPCPHCGGTDVRVYQNVSGAWSVECWPPNVDRGRWTSCYVIGPIFESKADAIAAWNRLSIAMEWARLLVAADEAHPGFAASVLAAGKAATT